MATPDDNPALTFGARIVRGLGMRVPDDPTERHVQAAFAALQACGVVFLLLQAALVLAWHGIDSPSARIRIGANLVSAMATLALLLTATRSARMRLAAWGGAVTILAYQIVFAFAFGLAQLPGVIIIALPLLAGLSMTETPTRTAACALAFAAVAALGLVVEPRYALPPTSVPAAVAVFVVIGFQTLYMLEYRAAMRRSLEEAKATAAQLAAANAELRAAIAERDRLAGRLATAERLEAMGRVAGGIAHDFNNLLTVIRGYADLLTRSVPDGTPAADDARQLQRALVRAARVSQDVLDFARPRPLDRAAVDLGDFIRELAPGLGAAVGAGHPLLVRTGDGSLVIQAERAQVERLLVNLVLNARDASPPKAPISIDVRRRTTAEGDRIVLAVADRGPGVRPEDRERIFEPFFTTKGTTGGTGLGLATSYALVQQHGGTLRVDDAPGGGAVFCSEFPASAAARPRAGISGETPGAAPRGRPLDGIEALVVEDDPGVRGVTVRFLQQAGAVVLTAEDGADGVAALETRASDGRAVQLVVSDLRLPRGSGAEVLQAARRLFPEAALVAMSGFLEDDAVAKMAEAGDLVFVAKPFTASQLVMAVEAARAGLHRE